MSIGGIIGAVAGGIIGFILGGPTGALYGMSLGYSLGSYIDPVTPDVPTPGAPLPVGAEIMSTTIGDPLPDLVGTAKITGHLLCFGKERTDTIYTEVEGAKGGDDPDPYISGYEYYMSWAVGIVAGPIDTLYTIYKGEDEVVWEGELNLPVSGGQETITLEGMGSAILYFGTDDQIANSDVGDIIGDVTINSPFRHFCWCFFDDCNIGNFNRCPTMKFVLRKSPEIAFSEDNIIQTYDYNPMHAIWYILHNLAGLPESWLHAADFTSAASTLNAEDRGICCLFHAQQNALSYIETINAHIDGIVRYGSDGKFHPKLIRDDYVDDDLLLIDENVMLDDPSFKRKSWLDTVNEMKVQYTEIRRLVPFPQGEWVAAMSQPGTPYVYLYDITYKVVIKLDTNNPPIIASVLPLDPIGGLNYAMGPGIPGTQRGGYCMDKDGNKLWYLFRNGTDGQLIEVDIAQPSMSIVKKTVFPGLLTRTVQDGCSDNTNTFWCDGAFRILKIENSDHSIVEDHYYDATELATPACATNKEGIKTIDTYNNQLYWNYVEDHRHCTPQYVACSYHVRTNLDFNILEKKKECGTGLGTPQWQNIIRIYGNYLFQHRAYYPSTGPLYKRDLSIFDKLDDSSQEYLQNILGDLRGYLFTVNHNNSAHPIISLHCINITDMSSMDSKHVTLYTESCVSALNVKTETVVLLRYDGLENKNYVAGFEANSTLNLLYDENPLLWG